MSYENRVESEATTLLKSHSGYLAESHRGNSVAITIEKEEKRLGCLTEKGFSLKGEGRGRCARELSLKTVEK